MSQGPAWGLGPSGPAVNPQKEGSQGGTRETRGCASDIGVTVAWLDHGGRGEGVPLEPKRGEPRAPRPWTISENGLDLGGRSHPSLGPRGTLERAQERVPRGRAVSPEPLPHPSGGPAESGPESASASHLLPRGRLLGSACLASWRWPRPAAPGTRQPTPPLTRAVCWNLYVSELRLPSSCLPTVLPPPIIKLSHG